MATQHRIGKVATAVKRDADGTLRVIYHSTAVVTVEASGRITLDHGGWKTSTTKTRMNQASNQLSLGFTVSQKKRNWFVSIDGHEIPFTHTPLVVREGE